jgi:quercetin dioxygenase-like cupin family protein
VAVMSGGRHHRAMSTTASPTTAGYSVAPGDGERIWSAGETMTVKATGERTGGNLVLLENVVPPGGGPPPHVHTREDEFLYVLAGRFDVSIGDQMHALAPGGFAYVPRGTVHSFANAGETTGRLLVGFTPGGIEGFFREAGRPATDDGPAPPVDDDEIARTIAAASTYGMQLAGFAE